MAKKKINIDIFPAHSYLSGKRYRDTIKKYGSGVIATGYNILIHNGHLSVY